MRIVFATLALAGSMTAALDNLPQLKEGLWSVTTQTISNPGDTKIEGSSSLCRNHAYDDKAREHSKTAIKGCTISRETFEDGKYTVVSHCEIPGRVIDSTSVTSTGGDNSSAHTESRTAYKPALAGKDETTFIMDQKYVGACPAGMEPGDRMDKDGKIIHINKPAK